MSRPLGLLEKLILLIKDVFALYRCHTQLLVLKFFEHLLDVLDSEL